MTGGAAGRVLLGGKDVGSGFAITDSRVLTAGHVVRDAATVADGWDGEAAGARGPLLAYVVDRGEPAGVPAVVAFQPEDGEPIAVIQIDVSTSLDVAVLHLQQVAPAVLQAPAQAAAEDRWRVETRPGRRGSYTLTGTVTDPNRRMWNEGGKQTTLIQLLVDQEVGDYKGYSGSPVIAAPAGEVLGVLVEQGRWRTSPQLGQLPPVANVLFAAPIDQVRSEFGLEGLAVARPARAVAGRTGRPLAEVDDPFALEVHRPIQPDSPQPSLPELPAYVPRDHDTALGGVVRAAADGRSGIVVLVGGSSTGKTRACWEALALLRAQDPPWRLWHPIDPSPADAALRELPALGPRTVVWLNEAQLYLDVAEGERVTAGLRELLRDPARAPVLVLATLWPRFWDDLTVRPTDNALDPHAQARELLAGHDITVPAAFTAAQLQRLYQARDTRLAMAAAGAQDGQVIQFLAGVPGLMARYRNAPADAAALIHAAMDARRLGTGIALPQAFLEAAAPGYLTGDEWDALGDDWLEQALDYAVKPAMGIRGPLTRIHPHPASSRATGPGPGDTGEQAAGQAGGGGPAYRLAVYLDQVGRQDRADQIPPAGFWTAATCARPADQAALGRAAVDRGLYRAAAQLHKNAASGDSGAAARLAYSLQGIDRGDGRPARWAAAHAAVDDPRAVAQLLDIVREAGGSQEAAALADRAAAHVPVDDPAAVSDLMFSMQEADASRQAAALLDRAAAQADSHKPYDMVMLMRRLLAAGASQEAAALADRAVAHVPLDDPGGVAWLLDWLREAGADRQADVLLGRDPATHVPLDEPGGVAALLGSLREAGATGQVAALADRAADRTPFNNPYAVGRLLDQLREAGADQQADALLDRAAAHAAIDSPDAVAAVLAILGEAGADQQAAALLDRDPAAHVTLDDPAAVARLLNRLREAGADQQAAALLDRDPAAHVTLDDPGAVTYLMDRLLAVGARQQVAALADRAAADVPLEDPGAVARLLDWLRDAGAGRQAAALLDRDPAAHAALHDPDAVNALLGSLWEAGATGQADALADRSAAHIALVNPRAVRRLLSSLREAGASQQAAVLIARLPAAGLFTLFWKVGDLDRSQFWFGRELDGAPAGSWGWDDLD